MMIIIVKILDKSINFNLEAYSFWNASKRVFASISFKWIESIPFKSFLLMKIPLITSCFKQGNFCWAMNERRTTHTGLHSLQYVSWLFEIYHEEWTKKTIVTDSLSQSPSRMHSTLQNFHGTHLHFILCSFMNIQSYWICSLRFEKSKSTWIVEFWLSSTNWLIFVFKSI